MYNGSGNSCQAQRSIDTAHCSTLHASAFEVDNSCLEQTNPSMAVPSVKIYLVLHSSTPAWSKLFL